MTEHPASAPGALFHAGELELQREAGDAERLARLGPRVIRRQLPEEHRAFFQLLPFVLVGSIDGAARPTASLLAGRPGFVRSPEPRELQIEALPRPEDPLARNLRPGAPLAVLGIQPHTRRRNRAAGRVTRMLEGGFSLCVEQSFGNCPRHITPRELVYAEGERPAEARALSALGPAQRSWLAGADTFFIASAHPRAAEPGPAAQGVDVSHRGGPPGFVSFTSDDCFSIPELRGNGFNNTLGNLRLNPKAGLLFIDFERGDLLSLAVHAERVSAHHPLAFADSTGYVLRFHLESASWVEAGSPLRAPRPPHCGSGE